MKDSQRIADLLEESRKEYCFSGYQLFAGRRGEVVSLASGKTSYWEKLSQPVNESTLFDIGSLTKVVATTSLLATGVDRGEIEVDEFVANKVFELKDTPLQAMRISDLLSHCGGLKPRLDLDKRAKKSLITWFCVNVKTIIGREYREKAVYSDLDFLLLGILCERLWGPISRSFDSRVRKPLHLREVTYGPVPPENAAATEFDTATEELFCGTVFDDNARLLGGVAAHAGLFATAKGLAPFCEAWLSALRGNSSWLSQSVARAFTTRTQFVEESSWALGWDTKSKAFSSSGDHFGPKTFGHLGFPGCSLWLDPEDELFVIFLTNRVHPSRYDERIKRIRPLLHNAVWEAFH